MRQNNQPPNQRQSYIARSRSPIMESLFIVLFGAYFTYHGVAAREQLVLPEGEERSILCTAPASELFLINWVFVQGQAGFVVGDEETLDNGMKGKRITFTATADVNNTNLRCVVTDLIQTTAAYALELTVIIQGELQYLAITPS